MKLKIAVQKSGRLNEDSLKLLKDCGIAIENGKQQLKASAANFPVELLFLRSADIPEYVSDGIADLGIVGENLLIEQERQVKKLMPLGFGRCRLSIAIPKEEDYFGPKGLEGKKIATSYPRTLQNYLQKNKISAEIHQISGSVEIAPNIGLADAICDLVSTGNTLFRNGLKEAERMFTSEACLIASSAMLAEKELLVQRLVFRLRAVLEARFNKYILLNIPNTQIAEITSILPGMKSPTILPLAKEGWSSLHSVINENDFWDVLDQLKEKGAEGILIAPIEKMIL